MSGGTRHSALLIVGAKSRIGIHVAARFAMQGFERIVHMPRNRARLRNAAFVLFLVVSSVKADIIEVDLAKEQSISDGFEEVEEELDNTPVEMVQFTLRGPSEVKYSLGPLRNCLTLR